MSQFVRAQRWPLFKHLLRSLNHVIPGHFQIIVFVLFLLPATRCYHEALHTMCLAHLVRNLLPTLDEGRCC
ncbi:unnamed protein product [Ixodes pacificus]